MSLPQYIRAYGRRYVRAELVTCQRCGGSGYLDQFKHIQRGVCFRCDGSGQAEPIKKTPYRPTSPDDVARTKRARDTELGRIAQYLAKLDRERWRFQSKEWQQEYLQFFAHTAGIIIWDLAGNERVILDRLTARIPVQYRVEFLRYYDQWLNLPRSVHAEAVDTPSCRRYVRATQDWQYWEFKVTPAHEWGTVSRLLREKQINFGFTGEGSGNEARRWLGIQVPHGRKPELEQLLKPYGQFLDPNRWEPVTARELRSGARFESQQEGEMLKLVRKRGNQWECEVTVLPHGAADYVISKTPAELVQHLNQGRFKFFSFDD